MDALGPSDPCELVVLKFSSQIGKTEVMNNAVGFVISYDPGPILIVQPSAKPMGEAWSKDRLAPMLRDTPVLKGLVKASDKRDSGNTILHKTFPGGHVSVAGSNSPAGLASRPIRYVFFDELDRFETTREGDPVRLAEKRSRAFWNRKILKVSSPTYEDDGIDAEYKRCDQQYEWQLQCLHCESRQFPKFKHFVWDEGDPGTVRYACEHCGAAHESSDESRVKRTGLWICVRNDGILSKAFWCNQWASPFASWADTVREFLASKDDPEQLRTVINTAFAETWTEPGESIDGHWLMERREKYPVEMPGGVVVTFGADVQADRIELEVVSWGVGEESWSLDYQIFEGEPTQREVWDEVHRFITETRYESLERKHSITAGCIDSGYMASVVYDWVKGARHAHLWATKGVEGPTRPLIEGRDKRSLRLRKRSRQGYKPELIGVDEGKSVLFRRLLMTKPGAGYCHFPIARDEEYFDQLTAERMQRRMVRGHAVREWVKTRPRNEALDCRILAHAAVRLLNPDYESLAKQKEQRADADKIDSPSRLRRRQNYVGSWA